MKYYFKVLVIIKVLVLKLVAYWESFQSLKDVEA
jgi:hypothetical protein